jgi:hypothetical protein
MLTALEYLGSVGIGVTSPQLFRADDGKVYVVKLQNNRMGPKVLVNEYVACWFGQRMQLCFPPSDLIELTTKVLQKSRRLKMMGLKQGPHFASQYLHHNRYVTRRDLQKAINKDAMAGVMLFDHLFHNVDRTKNRKNLLVRHEEEAYVLYAIDNSHLFVRGRWNEERLEKLTNKVVVNHYRAYGWLLKNFLSVEDFVPYVAKVKDITKDELTELVHSIPPEWLLKDGESEALLRYMMARCSLVDDIAQKLYQSIPDVNRRTYPNQRK